MGRKYNIEITLKDIESIKAFNGITEKSKEAILNIAKARLYERDETLFLKRIK